MQEAERGYTWFRGRLCKTVKPNLISLHLSSGINEISHKKEQHNMGGPNADRKVTNKYLGGGGGGGGVGAAGLQDNNKVLLSVRCILKRRVRSQVTTALADSRSAFIGIEPFCL